MAEGYDRYLDQVKANAWMNDVKDELDAVDSILESVAKECSTPPGEDDTLMIAFNDVSVTLQDIYHAMSDAFWAVIHALEDAIKKMLESIAENVQRIHQNIVVGQ